MTADVYRRLNLAFSTAHGEFCPAQSPNPQSVFVGGMGVALAVSSVAGLIEIYPSTPKVAASFLRRILTAKDPLFYPKPPTSNQPGNTVVLCIKNMFGETGMTYEQALRKQYEAANRNAEHLFHHTVAQVKFVLNTQAAPACTAEFQPNRNETYIAPQLGLFIDTFEQARHNWLSVKFAPPARLSVVGGG